VDEKSGMTGDCHVPFCGSPGVRFPRATRRLRQHERCGSQTLDAFEGAVAAIPNVLQAQRLFGDPDYLLRVITRDLPAFEKLYDDHLATLPGVQRLSSTLVMKSVVENRPLPL